MNRQRIEGGLGAILGWWPIRAYRPCPNFVERGGFYQRSGQGLDEIAFGRGENIIEQGHFGDAMYVISSGTCGKCASHILIEGEILILINSHFVLASSLYEIVIHRVGKARKKCSPQPNVESRGLLRP